jgi:hypothetical protein
MPKISVYCFCCEKLILTERNLEMTITVTLESESHCAFCGEYFRASDDITIREDRAYHTECLTENLKD